MIFIECISKNFLKSKYLFFVLLFLFSILFNNFVSAQTTTSKTTESSSANDKVNVYIEQNYQVPKGYTGPIPECAFKGTCRDVNKLVELLINIGKFIFGIVGTLALGVFIFGGFTLVFSRGNPETVKKGTGMMINAAIGLAIVFGAYILINFILDVLQVKESFQGV